MPDTATSPVLEELTETNAMMRSVNQGLMVAWINADLINRAGHDVRKSIVLYDEDQMFVQALPAVLGPVLDPKIHELAYNGGVRFYSHGIV